MWLHIHKWESYKRGGDFPIWVVSVTLVVISFGHPSVYYNYFENCDMYINTYSADKCAMKAVIHGIMGQFKFVGKSPVSLFPFHKQYEV